MKPESRMLFRRKPESSGERLRAKSHVTRGRAFWLDAFAASPAFAGMTLRGMIWLYRHSLSYFFGDQCRFFPTCSAYADEALRVHGVAKGSALAFRRFCRCHPWGGQGFDPVPQSRGSRPEDREDAGYTNR